ncbi:MAG TPA: hypothetical protein VJ935_04415, partial [Acidimicrobiia bacterium]|nr:hypothetical protein [Acidimicrobiia bacterium]
MNERKIVSFAVALEVRNPCMPAATIALTTDTDVRPRKVDSFLVIPRSGVLPYWSGKAARLENGQS